MVSTEMRDSKGSVCYQPVKGVQGGLLENIPGEHFLKTKLEKNSSSFGIPAGGGRAALKEREGKGLEKMAGVS